MERTTDAISDHLTIYQTRGGYRFGQDALLLARGRAALVLSHF